MTTILQTKEINVGPTIGQNLEQIPGVELGEQTQKELKRLARRLRRFRRRLAVNTFNALAYEAYNTVMRSIKPRIVDVNTLVDVTEGLRAAAIEYETKFNLAYDHTLDDIEWLNREELKAGLRRLQRLRPHALDLLAMNVKMRISALLEAIPRVKNDNDLRDVVYTMANIAAHVHCVARGFACGGIDRWFMTLRCDFGSGFCSGY